MASASAETRVRDETEPARADARRNRALILTAAQRAFAEHGTSVSLAEVARRAGVGAGTVHRHFPAKLDLVEAVVQQRIDRLTAVAIGYRDAPDAGAAFLDFCARVVIGTPRNKAMCDVLDSDDGWPRDLLRGAGERFRHALGALLAAAQREGSVRADLTLPDVLAVFAGCVAIQRVSGHLDELSRPAAMVLQAMRTTPPGDVTKLETRSPGRNETTAHNETDRCPVCGSALRASGTGRPARYCSPACRQKAHRRRRAAADAHDLRAAAPSSA
ncbi:TetR/AcrR family transcriptional regulator [Nocardia blacklockiae]|uniref:TetR/AcrR family transcriptional regulator n=1 Tax=Nocardia blacklockiae TaxID=480036 RepID=UPI00189436D5|nr:TetR/AcrR family transcriptional regulator [Nocardia blacklockiae]MBF6173795.1 helix-turn-helix transcriptional regulator [Nocardia blacklockiae]